MGRGVTVVGKGRVGVGGDVSSFARRRANNDHVPDLKLREQL